MFKMYPLWNYQHKSPWTCACCQQNNHPSTIKIIKIINSFQLYLFFFALKRLAYSFFFGSQTKTPKKPPFQLGLQPWKINMEPTNHPFGKENDLPNLHEDMFQPLIFRVVEIIEATLWLWFSSSRSRSKKLKCHQDGLPFFWMDMILSEIYPPKMVHCFRVCACFHASWALGQGIFVGAIYLMG